MSKTPWSTNAALDATARTYDSSAVQYDSASVTYDGVNYADLVPALTAWTPVTP